MSNVYAIIEQLAATASTNEKQNILRANKNDQLLREVFHLAYNPLINYWIKPESSYSPGASKMTLETLKQLDQLIHRKVTGNAARAFLSDLMGTLVEQDQIILARIINHDLRCGTSDTLASKVWPNLVPEFPVMLCSKYDEKTKKHLEKALGRDKYLHAQLKSDGGRVLVTVDTSGVTLRSRNGSALETYNLFDKYFQEYPGYVFDGELVILNPDRTPDRKKSNGIYTKLVRGTATKEEVALFEIHLWDMISADEYTSGVGKETYEERFVRLTNFMTDTDLIGQSPLKLIESDRVMSMEQVDEYFVQMRARGQEGCIIKVASSVFQDKRSKDFVKIKAEETADLVCVGVEEGTGKYQGRIGALVCQTADGKLVVSVGTGLKDDDRHPDLVTTYLRSIIEVGYNEIITSKGRDTKSLFLPVFKGIRHDKKQANYLDELK